jgi:hypothetical protein
MLDEMREEKYWTEFICETNMKGILQDIDMFVHQLDSYVQPSHSHPNNEIIPFEPLVKKSMNRSLPLEITQTCHRIVENTEKFITCLNLQRYEKFKHTPSCFGSSPPTSILFKQEETKRWDDETQEFVSQQDWFMTFTPFQQCVLAIYVFYQVIYSNETWMRFYQTEFLHLLGFGCWTTKDNVQKHVMNQIKQNQLTKQNDASFFNNLTLYFTRYMKNHVFRVT